MAWHTDVARGLALGQALGPRTGAAQGKWAITTQWRVRWREELRACQWRLVEPSHKAGQPDQGRVGEGRGQAPEDLGGLSRTQVFTLRVEGTFQNNWAP